MYKKKFATSEGVLLSLTLLSAVSLASPHTSADSSGAVDVSLTIPSVCSLSITDDDLIQTIYPGTDDTIGASKIKALCNDNDGLAVYAVGYTGDSYGDNNLRLEGTELFIPTSTVEDTNSRWNMTIAAATGSYAPTIAVDFTTAHIIPAQYTKVAYRNSQTDTGEGATGANFTATFDAYVSAAQAAGIYTGKVKFLLIHPNIIDSSTSPVTETLSVLPTMQDVSTWGSSITAGQEIIAVDARDGKTYTVARLADGNLWMTQNLDFNIDSTKTYTPADTDLPANTTWTPSHSTHATGDTAWGWDSNAQSYDPGDIYWNGKLNRNWESSYENYISDYGDPHFHTGNYYNWAAAVAVDNSDSYTGDGVLIDRSICPAGWTLPRPGTGEDSFSQMLAGYGFTDNPFHNDDTLWDIAPHFVLASVWDGELEFIGAYGEYWSSVAGGPYTAYGEYFDVDSDEPTLWHSDNVGRAWANSVRCIARPVSSTITGL